MKTNFKKLSMWLLAAVACTSMVACNSDDNDGGDNSGKVDPSTIASANLVAYMPFDGNANDIAGSHAVTATGTPHYVAGVRGQAFQGDSAGFIYALPTGDRIATAPGLTFSMWLRTPAPTGGSPAMFQINGTTGDWDMPGSFNIQMQDAAQLVDSVGFKAYLFNTATEWKGQWSDLFSTPSFPSNKWFHFVVMYNQDSSSYRAYANGELVYNNVRYAGPEVDGVQPLLGNMVLPADANKLYVGAWWKLLEGMSTDAWAQYFKGNFDELRIYDRGLSDAEVKALYDAEVSQL